MEKWTFRTLTGKNIVSDSISTSFIDSCHLPINITQYSQTTTHTWAWVSARQLGVPGRRQRKKASWPVLCGRAAQRKLKPCCEQSWESTFENVLQPIGAEVEFHVCNYWTTGCKGSIWSGKEKQEGGVGQDVRPGWKVKKRQRHTSPLCPCLLYSKRYRQAITVNEMKQHRGGYILEKRTKWWINAGEQTRICTTNGIP